MRKSLTLSELLLATVILAVVLSALLALFVNCIILNEANRNLTIALTHAQYVMEEIKDTDFSSITTGSWNDTLISSRGLSPLDNESINIAVAGSGPLDVGITVNWQDNTGRGRNVSLRTVITEP